MSSTIPDAVLRADAAHHALLERVAFSRHLNPTNVVKARKIFRAGAEVPPFEYIPLTQSGDLLREIDGFDPSREHPAGALVGSCIDGTRRMIRALTSRSAEDFDAMNQAAGWYPDKPLLAQRHSKGSPNEPMDIPAEAMVDCFTKAFAARHMSDWHVETDSVMSARVLVDSAKRLIRVSDRAKFRSRDLTRLVVHEIDVHAARARNGRKQALRCFSTGLPGSLITEEGLAMMAEETSGTASPGVLHRQTQVVQAIDHARTASFRSVYDNLSERVGPGLAWGISLRVKRGLARPEEPGVYAKDSVYLAGRTRVKDWLDDGGDIRHLYVGKVGVDDPVKDWLEQGWVHDQPVPSFWLDEPAS